MSQEPSAQQSRLGLADVLQGLRQDLQTALQTINEDDITFPVESAEVVVHVGVTRQGNANGGVHIWVVELGGGGSYSKDEIHTVTLGPVADEEESARTLTEKP